MYYFTALGLVITGSKYCRLSPNEAALMDPQGRLLLEQTGLVIADSEPDRLFSGSEAATGVYVGVMHMEYIQFMTSKAPVTHSAVAAIKAVAVVWPGQPSLRLEDCFISCCLAYQRLFFRERVLLPKMSVCVVETCIEVSYQVACCKKS